MNAGKPLNEYYKVPFREVYCETRLRWVRICVECLFKTIKWHIKNTINPQPDIPGVPRT